jgi:hypothetical protein
MSSSPAHIDISQELLEVLVSALRRHAAGDAGRALAAWAEETRPEFDDVIVWRIGDPLTGWVHREACLHVAGDRFEHALCLVDLYRPPAPDRGAPLFHPRSPQ